jgi:hypothetical protein
MAGHPGKRCIDIRMEARLKVRLAKKGNLDDVREVLDLSFAILPGPKAE